ncbi:MAG: type I restriction enzyme HsdR N-terminal domain-containing protein [Spirosomataceae bacterium]
MYPPLIFPKINPKIKKIDEKLYIFDNIRRKFVFLTPEEWVRQHVTAYLVNELAYPKSLLSLESGLTYHELSKRSDVQAFDRQGNPFLLIECKATNIPLSPAVFEQASRYNFVLKAPFMALTNGLQTLCWHINWQTGVITPLEQLIRFEELPSL